MDESNLILLFSPPRAGSTFVQRVLASHSQIDTTSESWLAFPLLYSNKQGLVAVYDHATQMRAHAELIRQIQGGEERLRSLRKKYLLGAFGAAKGDARYFLEKTPRNALVCRELLQMFPLAKKIFLWRNPLSVVASMIETFGEGKWRLFNYYIDLFDGLEELLLGWNTNPPNSLAVRYEDLVTKPIEQWSRVFAFLDLPFEERALKSFSEKRLSLKIGDRAGVAAYDEISVAPIEKWRTTICNSFRNAWARRYLRWLGSERLELMGYDASFLDAQLKSNAKTSEKLLSDLVRAGYGELDRRLNSHLWRNWITGRQTSGRARIYR